MSIRVGTIINVNKAFNNYQQRLEEYKSKLSQAQLPEEQKHWGSMLQMTEEELEAFMNVIIPDPVESHKLDIRM